MFSITLETLLLKHKVSQGYSPARENAGSLTPFEMTCSKRTPTFDVSCTARFASSGASCTASNLNVQQPGRTCARKSIALAAHEGRTL